jgi:hypothetical protein
MKGAKGKFGKESPLKKIAAVAGAGLAGLALGLRYDPNKRWKIISDIHGEDVPLKEDRPTQLFQLITDMRKHPDVEKVISVNYLTDGISAFIRTTDGNAYEMEIRPAPFAKGHEEKRGITEGWKWHILGESFDMTDETCTRCGKGQYVETGIQDDMRGVLHCNNCAMEIDRHAEENDQVENNSAASSGENEMSCKCGSNRVARVSAKCSDLCWINVPHLNKESDGYVPTNVGLGDDSDYIDVGYCLDCGSLQGKFPVSDNSVIRALKST